MREALPEAVQAASEAFLRDGFAVIENLAGEHELPPLRSAYDAMLSGQVEGDAVDRSLGGLTRQIMFPHLGNPAFADSPVIERARTYAAALLGVQAPPLMFSMLIYKPPGHPHETPWHQDMAYAGRPVTPAGTRLPNNVIVQFWLTLDDVSDDMGCMEFLPGVQNSPMPEHYVYSGDPGDESRLLAVVDPASVFDLTNAVRCPLKAGGATVHGYATPHHTGPNRSQTRGRRAFIFSFASPDALSAIAGDRGDWGVAEDHARQS